MRTKRVTGWLGVAVLLGGMATPGALGQAMSGKVGTGTVASAAPMSGADAKEVESMRAKLADWPQLGRYRAEDEALKGKTVAKDEDRVVFFGDSITDAWGRRPNTGTFFPGKPYVNRGISGQTTPQMVVRFRQDVIDLKPKAVVILAGTNDVAGNTGPMTPEMTEDNFRSMADLAKANGIKVIFASILPASDFPWRPGLEPAGQIKVLNEWLKKYCEENGYVYLDYYSALTDEKGGMREGLSFDGVHPTAAGYALMTPLAEKAIGAALAQ
jgi:lysophospholipase L1-like esterase